MSYEIQGMIGKVGVFSQPDSSTIPLIPLEEGFVFLPFGKDFRIGHGIEELALLEGDESQEAAVMRVCAHLAPLGQAVYIEAEYFGGIGTQGSICLTDGASASTKEISPQAINEALKWIGVVKGASFDEFESLGLGRFRSTDLWASITA